MTQEDECAGDDLAGVLDGPRINLWMTLLEIFNPALASIYTVVLVLDQCVVG